MTTREKDGKEQLTSDLAQAVTASEVTEAVQRQRKVDLHEQLLFMDPIQEAGDASSRAQASQLTSRALPGHEDTQKPSCRTAPVYVCVPE